PELPAGYVARIGVPRLSGGPPPSEPPDTDPYGRWCGRGLTEGPEPSVSPYPDQPPFSDSDMAPPARPHLPPPRLPSRAFRSVIYGSELRSLLGHRPHQGWARSSQDAVTYTSTSTSAPCTRTG